MSDECNVVFVVVKVDSFGPYEPLGEEDVSSWKSLRGALDEAKELRSKGPFSEYRIEVRERPTPDIFGWQPDGDES